MKLRILFLFLIFCSFSCGKRTYYIAEVDNPDRKPNVAFQGFEDLGSPKFEHLKQKYMLDTVFHGETDEFKRILLLRHWIKSVIAIDDHGDPYPGEGDVEAIIDNGLKGTGYHCGHYMIVQNAILNAYGYVTRTLGAGPGVKGGPDGHHGIDEVWLNQYNKWFLSDNKYDHHFEKNGIPLSALEIREEFLKNRAADIIVVKGPERVPTETDEETKISKERFAQTYTWIEWHGHNDIFTVWPAYTELLVMYNDDFFRNNVWIWDNKPHWAYSRPEFMKLVDNPDHIYWTPNTISSDARIEGRQASIILDSDTPNLREYQVRTSPGGTWARTDPSFTLDLKKKRYELIFRVMNLAGVAGPEHRIIIESK